MRTIAEQLNLLINTKNKFKSKFRAHEVEVSSDLPFNSYPDLIDQLVVEREDTTTDQDLLQLSDLACLLGTADYVEKVYTDDEIQEVHTLVDSLIGGVSVE